MKQVTSWKADSGRLYDNASEALADDAISQISKDISIPYEMAQKVLKNWHKIHAIVMDYQRYTEAA